MTEDLFAQAHTPPSALFRAFLDPLSSEERTLRCAIAEPIGEYADNVRIAMMPRLSP